MIMNILMLFTPRETKDTPPLANGPSRCCEAAWTKNERRFKGL